LRMWLSFSLLDMAIQLFQSCLVKRLSSCRSTSAPLLRTPCQGWRGNSVTECIACKGRDFSLFLDPGIYPDASTILRVGFFVVILAIPDPLCLHMNFSICSLYVGKSVFIFLGLGRTSRSIWGELDLNGALQSVTWRVSPLTLLHFCGMFCSFQYKDLVRFCQIYSYMFHT
jgi:hypothetical protein